MRFFLSSLFLFLIVLFNCKRFIPSSRSINEEKIAQNIMHLQKYRWFQELLDDARFAPLIVHDPDVRNIIGKLPEKHVHCKTYGNRSRRKIEHIVYEKTKQTAH